MSPARVVVDGSNIATEGRANPSLRQLDEAVRAFLEEHPHDELTVVVDATFGHRIDKAEAEAFEEAIEAGELISPPAGAVGRGDAFLLTIAAKTNATVLSNDSFQEFHGEHPWLFDEGRLIGGKPVPEVGWIFQQRLPVRGPKSREAVRKAKRQRTRPSERPATDRPATNRAAPKHQPKTPPRRSSAAARPEPADAGGADAGRRRRSRRRGAPKPVDPVNAFESFIEFAAKYPPGSRLEAEIVEYASHGAYADVDGARCYIPIKLMGDPIPRSAREVVQLGERREFVVNQLDAPRRAIELALPGLETPDVESGLAAADLAAGEGGTVSTDRGAAPAGAAPISGYDTLSARQITGAVGNLDLDGLRQLQAYEEANRARKTVLATIEGRIRALTTGAKARPAGRTSRGSAAKAPAEEVAGPPEGATEPAARKAAGKKAPAEKRAAKRTTAKKAAARKATAKAPAAKGAAAKEPAAKKRPAATKKAAAKKAPATKTAAKKTAAKKAAAKKTAAKKTAAKKTAAKKTAAKKTAAKKPSAKRPRPSR